MSKVRHSAPTGGTWRSCRNGPAAPESGISSCTTAKRAGSCSHRGSIRNRRTSTPPWLTTIPSNSRRTALLILPGGLQAAEIDRGVFLGQGVGTGRSFFMGDREIDCRGRSVRGWDNAFGLDVRLIDFPRSHLAQLIEPPRERLECIGGRIEFRPDLRPVQ